MALASPIKRSRARSACARARLVGWLFCSMPVLQTRDRVHFEGSLLVALILEDFDYDELDALCNRQNVHNKLISHHRQSIVLILQWDEQRSTVVTPYLRIEIKYRRNLWPSDIRYLPLDIFRSRGISERSFSILDYP